MLSSQNRPEEPERGTGCESPAGRDTADSQEDGIVDYSDRDFQQYWSGRSKAILHASESRMIRDLLPKGIEWFIDLGCGFGRLLPTYEADHENLVLVDYAVEQLRIASTSVTRPNVHFVAADACRLPFRDKVFDGGICVRLMHHIAAPDALMREISRVSTDGACLLFNYMNRRNLLRILKYGKDSFRITHSRTSKIIYGTHPEYCRRLAAGSGFCIDAVRGTGLVHQMVHASRRFSGLVERSPFLASVMSFAEQVSDPLLGRLNLALMQYVRLRKSGARARQASAKRIRGLADILRCPSCSGVSLEQSGDTIACQSCGNMLYSNDRIYDCRRRPDTIQAHAQEGKP